MPSRLLLILALIIQPLAWPAATTVARIANCGEASCCEVVARTTCCDEVVRETRCRRSGGDCVCVEPGDRDSSPQAPRPQERNELGPLLFAATRNVIVLSVPEPARLRWTRPAIHRTHNRTQALLCIWRT